MTKNMKQLLARLQEHGRLYGFKSNPVAKALARRGLITIRPDDTGAPSWAVFELRKEKGAN